MFKSKKQKLEEKNIPMDSEMLNPDATVSVEFQSEAGEIAGQPVQLPCSIDRKSLQSILNLLLNQENSTIPYTFFVDEREVTKDLNGVLASDFSEENLVTVLYQAQAVFQVNPVTRCAATLPGHADSVLHATFAPDGRTIASCSGDTTVRFWDTNTDTPLFTCRGHKNHVLIAAWSPDGSLLASGCKKGHVLIWNPDTGEQVGKAYTLHTQAVVALCWEPLHLSGNGRCNRVASASKDGTVRVWNLATQRPELALSGHTKGVNCLRWSGEGFMYTGSMDTTINVWKVEDGSLLRTLSNKFEGSGHAHRVNKLVLNTDYTMRTGHDEPKNLQKVVRESIKDPMERLRLAGRRYKACMEQCGNVERMCSASDDFTLYLWEPSDRRKPIARMHGHQQLVNDVRFSPDTRMLASASFDKTLRVWDGVTGKFKCVLRGHVGPVHIISWSADSRLIVSCSADSTIKVWSVAKKGLLMDLPGHADQVYWIDWSPDGHRVVSGSKDKTIKVWRQ